jgi:hypothetical protein
MANPQKAPPKFLSFNWIRGVADDKRISIVHRLALIRLCMHRRDDGRCHPGYDTVANEIGVHRATVFRAIDVGVRFEWLAKPIRHGQTRADFILTVSSNVAPVRPQGAANVAGGRPQGNPNVAGVQSQSRTGAHAKSQRQRGSPAASTASTRNGGSNGKKENGGSKSPRASRSDKNPPKNLSEEKTAGEAFTRFWGTYPKRVAKDRARKAWDRRIKDGVDAETLIAGAQRYAVERQSQDPKFTKHPATWLNGGCWEDEAPGAPVIDEHGNVVGFEREEEEQRRLTPLERALAMDGGW